MLVRGGTDRFKKRERRARKRKTEENFYLKGETEFGGAEEIRL